MVLVAILCWQPARVLAQPQVPADIIERLQRLEAEQQDLRRQLQERDARLNLVEGVGQIAAEASVKPRP